MTKRQQEVSGAAKAEPKTFADLIHAAMRPGESEASFAKRVGFSVAYVNRWTTGFTVPPPETVIQVAEAVGANPGKWLTISHPEITECLRLYWTERSSVDARLIAKAGIAQAAAEQLRRFAHDLDALAQAMKEAVR